MSLEAHDASPYPIANSVGEVPRLRMQADLFRADVDAMLERIGVEPGWRCLDLCCGVGGITDLLSQRVGARGEVIGADADAAKLDVARDWARANCLDNVRFEAADAFATGFDAASFDLVHTRFALGIIPGGLRILDHLLTLVRPGGVVFVEEPNVRSMECAPAHPDFERALALMTDTFVALGADPNLGPRLFGIFHDLGLSALRMRPCAHALRAGEPMMMHLPDTLAGMREAVLAAGLADAAELDTLLPRLRAHLSRPGTMALSFTMMQVAGRVPGDGLPGAARG